MHIRRLEPPDQPALEKFLLPQLATSMFLLANSRQVGFVDHGQRLQGTYIAVFDDHDEMLGVIAHYWNKNIITQAPPALLPQLLKLLLKHSDRPIHGLIGPQAQVAALLAAIPQPHPPRQLDEPEFLYELNLNQLQIPDNLVNGRFHGRRATPADQDILTLWRRDYHIEALGAADSPALRALCHNQIKTQIAAGTIWLLLDGGIPVSMTGFNATTTEAVQVGGVWTPTAYRSRGYARAAVAASLRDAQAEGAYLAILFTGETNYPAQKAYQALGFRHTADYHLLTFTEPITTLPPH
ncbi:MAG TPA: GNAT family N-acetyltransferase [Anaerolineae bacterium]|nr:GNAT family N-acetyltransferase [Anaerolineae bacterium]